MIRLVMEGARLTFWPSLSLAIFTIWVLAMLVWLFRPGSRAFYRAMSGMVLDDTESKSGRKE